MPKTCIAVLKLSTSLLLLHQIIIRIIEIKETVLITSNKWYSYYSHGNLKGLKHYVDWKSVFAITQATNLNWGWLIK